MSEPEEDLAATLGPVQRDGVGQAARQRRLPARGAGGLCARRGRRARGHHGAAADERGARAGPRPERRRAPGRLRGRAGRLGACRGAAGRRVERHQGRGPHAQPAARLARRPRAGAVRQQHRPRDARRDARGVSRVVPRLPPLPAAPRRACSAASGCPGGTSSRPSAATARTRPGRGTNAAAFVVEQFGTYSPRLAELPRRALRERWIDAEPRDGKRDGAFCMGVRGDESAVFLNFAPELRRRQHAGPRAGPRLSQPQPGPAHAVAARHADGAGRDRQHLLRDHRRQRGAPGRPGRPSGSPSSSTSSRAAARSWSTSTRASCSSHAVFEGRARRELSVAELNALMLDAQRETYGDGLDPDALAPVHVGGEAPLLLDRPLLLQLALHLRPALRPRPVRALPRGPGPVPRRLRRPAVVDRPRAAPPTSPPASASTSARPAFWRASLDVVREQIDEFERLTTP